MECVIIACASVTVAHASVTVAHAHASVTVAHIEDAREEKKLTEEGEEGQEQNLTAEGN